MTSPVLTRPPERITTAEGHRPSNFRPDVEGLRAVAVGLVLLFHSGLSYIPGGFIGVDVFFVISGFLITGMLVREVERTGTVSLSRFYARRIKRLLPAAVVVLAVTAIFTWALASITDRGTFGGDIVAAALYVVNWRFATRSVDYLAEDVGVSPVQHFWSLAVEEQFYIVWPLLLLVVGLVVRRMGWSIRPTMGLALSVVAVPSFVWSIMMTASNKEAAFFVTTTRLWELAVGAAVAIALPLVKRFSQEWGFVLAWGGLLTIVVAAFQIDSSTPWPGSAALFPVLGTAAVIAGGVAAGAQGPVSLLGTRPFVWVGGLSYSLYLWHWPMIVLATAYFDDLRTRYGLLIVALSIIPAWLTHRLVENPVRFSPVMSRAPRFALMVGAVLSFAGVIAGVGLAATTPSASAPASAPKALGAAVLDEGSERESAGEPVESVAWMTPEPVEAPKDVPAAYDEGCQVSFESKKPVTCEYGDPEGEITIALVGDSKALQWVEALDSIGRDEGWKIQTYTKSACPFTAATIDYRGKSKVCQAWGSEVFTQLIKHRPDYVLTSQGKKTAYAEDEGEAATKSGMVEGLTEYWDKLSAKGIHVIALADTPQPGMDVYECVAENLDHLTACGFEREEAIDNSAANVQKEARREAKDASWIDLNNAICPSDECVPVIGNVLIYRQGSHITNTYAQSLEPRLVSELKDIISSHE